MSLKRTIVDSGNGLSTVRRQAITWSNAGLLSIGLVGTNFSEISIGILSIKEMHFKMSSGKMEAVLPRSRWASSCNNGDPVRWYIYAPSGINNPIITTLETYFFSQITILLSILGPSGSAFLIWPHFVPRIWQITKIGAVKWGSQLDM